MTTFLIDLVLGFWLLLFGGIAILPLITRGNRHQSARPAEDRVISIAPARPSATRPAGERAPHLPDHDHGHRPEPPKST